MTRRHRAPADERLNQQVRNAYPQLITELMKWALQSTFFPLDQMATANQYLGDTRVLRKTDEEPIPVNPTALKGQHDLITATLAFRDACSRITLDEETSNA